MDPLGSGVLPGQRGVEWVAVPAAGSVFALDELDCLAAGDVDGGKEFKDGRHGGEPFTGVRAQGRYSVATQLASSWAPASPDFSGWNWVAHSGPFSTAATNGVPWVDQVTSGGFRCGLVVCISQVRTP